PGGHLAAILIARQTIGIVVIERVENLTYTLLRLPWLAGPDVEISDVMRGLIAVRVLADESSDVGRRIGRQLRALVEQLVELLEEWLTAAKLIDESLHVMLEP